MVQQREVVITGVGVVSPLGTGCDSFWQSLSEGRSGVRLIPGLEHSDLPWRYGGVIADFDPKQYVKPRKSLKVMGREIQTAYGAAMLAAEQAGLQRGSVPPERFGVVLGSEMLYGELEELEAAYRACQRGERMEIEHWGEVAMSRTYPLWMLKFLPNMAACHIGIGLDARGPNNTLTLDETSSLAAVIEAAGVIQRGHADVMVTGGTGSRINPTRMAFGGCQHLVRFDGIDPQTASRPFDMHRKGIVHGEGAAALILESREYAEARGAPICGVILGQGNAYEKPRMIRKPGPGQAIVRSIRQALDSVGLMASDISHVNAHGAGSREDDVIEAQGIRHTLGNTHVTALKSYFGHLGAGGGAVELAASVLSLKYGEVPATLNYEHPDPDCPVNVLREPLREPQQVALVLNQSTMGHAVALLIGTV